MNGINYVLLCDQCGQGWLVSNQLEFSRKTEEHRFECPGHETPTPMPEPQDVA